MTPTSPTPEADAAGSTQPGNAACRNHHLQSLTRGNRCQEKSVSLQRNHSRLLTPPSPKCPIKAEQIWTLPPDCQFQGKTDPGMQRKKGQRIERATSIWTAYEAVRRTLFTVTTRCLGFITDHVTSACRETPTLAYAKGPPCQCRGEDHGHFSAMAANSLGARTHLSDTHTHAQPTIGKHTLILLCCCSTNPLPHTQPCVIVAHVLSGLSPSGKSNRDH